MSKERDRYQIVFNKSGVDAVFSRIMFHSDSPMAASEVIDRLKAESHRERIKGNLKTMPTIAVISVLATGRINELIGDSFRNTGLDQPTQAFISLAATLVIGMASLSGYRSAERNFTNANKLRLMARGLEDEILPSDN